MKVVLYNINMTSIEVSFDWMGEVNFRSDSDSHASLYIVDDLQKAHQLVDNFPNIFVQPNFYTECGHEQAIIRISTDWRIKIKSI